MIIIFSADSRNRIVKHTAGCYFLSSTWKQTLYQIDKLFRFGLLSPKMQDGNTSYLWYLLSTLFLLLLTCKLYVSYQFHERISNLRSRRSEDVSPHKIIVACEPNNLFFRFSRTQQPGYSEIVLPQNGWQWFWARCWRLLGRGYFYRLKQSKKNISNFLETMAQNDRVELFLYTTLPLNVVQAILERLNILRYFPQSLRRSCAQLSCQHIKHPTQVDIHTKRVLILTGSKDDHQEEDNKYFLVINKREFNLAKTARLLEKLIINNQETDEFHNQLAVVKAHIEPQTQHIGD